MKERKSNSTLPGKFIGLVMLLTFQGIFNFHVLNAQVLQTPDGFGFRAMFYNVENYFDPFDDSLTLDDAFTPEGDYHWTWDKMNEKALKIFKVAVAAGNPHPPALIAFAEIENSFVIHYLLNKTPMQRLNYMLVHQESPDRRGIDVALIFNDDEFTLLDQYFYPVHFPFAPQSRTRDILYACLLHNAGDTVHVFVNHWPSKYGGAFETEAKRMHVAQTLRHVVDSLLSVSAERNILIMGDFNDPYDAPSLVKGLDSKTDFTSPRINDLYNLTSVFPDSTVPGTHKYQGEWDVIDQVIVSGNLLLSKSKLHTGTSHVGVLLSPFLLEKDERNFGVMPYRTNLGFRYHGGYSDHLPVLIDFFVE